MTEGKIRAVSIGVAATVSKDADHRSGQCDTALFMPSGVLSKPGRGCPKTYEIKITPDAIRNMPVIAIKLTLYGKE